MEFTTQRHGCYSFFTVFFFFSRHSMFVCSRERNDGVDDESEEVKHVTMFSRQWRGWAFARGRKCSSSYRAKDDNCATRTQSAEKTLLPLAASDETDHSPLYSRSNTLREKRYTFRRQWKTFHLISNKMKREILHRTGCSCRFISTMEIRVQQITICVHSNFSTLYFSMRASSGIPWLTRKPFAM